MNIRPFAAADWELLRECRITAVRDAPLAFIDRLEDALARTEEQWRESLARSTTRLSGPGASRLYVAEGDGGAGDGGDVDVDSGDGSGTGTGTGTGTVDQLRGGDRWLGVAGGFHGGDHPDAMVVFFVFVRPAARGTGVLAALLEHVTALAGTVPGVQRLVLEVHARNPRAIAAYRRLGFVPTGTTRPHPLYPGESELEMERPLRR